MRLVFKSSTHPKKRQVSRSLHRNKMNFRINEYGHIYPVLKTLERFHYRCRYRLYSYDDHRPVSIFNIFSIIHLNSTFLEGLMLVVY